MIPPEQTAAALQRVITLARNMQTWCSPHNVAVGYADSVAEALIGAPAGQNHGRAVAQLDDFEQALGRADDEWRQRAVQAEERFVASQKILGDVLAVFTEHGHPGRACLRTGWVDEWRVTQWRRDLAALWRGDVLEREVPQ
ncbi:hypothetical protein [Streptosporangium sp. NPDC051022]|uniref:hypothetical protein n=1 Tax=Streptosporangium sp. NPDC051022 TaxID=3155752 RepID=UPI00342672B4